MRRHEGTAEEGYTIIIVALVLFVFLGFCALAADVGIANSARTGAQRAADAAALAGAFTFVTNPTTVEATAIAIATDRATVTAQQNKVLGDAVGASNTTVAVVVTFATRQVKVTVTHTQPAFFARALGQNNVTVSATALAEASITAKGDKCTKPWFIPNTAIGTPPVSTRPICQASPAGGCFSSPKQILIDPSTGAVTAYGSSKIGRAFIVKPQSPGCGTISPGQFLAIRLGCAGADCYRENITTCASVTVSCFESGSTYCTETGDMVGPTRQGVCDLICYNGAANCGNGNQCARDSFVSIGQYQHPAAPDGDGRISDTSRSLVVAPIIDVCSFCASGGFPSGGSCSLTVIGYALLFIEGTDNGTGGGDCSNGQPGIAARLINITSCSGAGGGGGGGGINPGETGPFATPVRLIRTP